QAKAAFEKKKADLEKQLADYQEKQFGSQVKSLRGLDPKEGKKVPDAIAKLIERADKLDAKQRQTLFDYLGKEDKTYSKLTKTLADHVKNAPVAAYVPALAAGADRKTHLLIRGDFLRPGVPVDA